LAQGSSAPRVKTRARRSCLMQLLRLAAVIGAVLGSQAGDHPATAAANSYSAAHAANVVAASAQQLATRAQQTLVRAHTAIEKVRAGTAGLSAQQQGHLAQAERSLQEATKKVEYEQLDQAEWLAGVAAESGADAQSLDSLEAAVNSIEKQLGGMATATERQELETLKVKVAKQRAGGQAETGSTLGSLQDKLSGLRRQLEAAEDIEALEAALESGGKSKSNTATSSDVADLRKKTDALQKKFDQLQDAEDVSDEQLDELHSEVRELQEEVAEDLIEDDNAVASAAEDSVMGDGPDADVPGATPRQASGGTDVDLDMPYGELEPFGREDTGQELTDASIRESDLMVDQLERAQVAETKRSVFRALTRLRGAAISSFDGIARAQTGNIDEYAKTNKWRDSHPLHHLASEESDVSKWAFPANADVQLNSAVHSEPATGRLSVSELLQQ